MIKLISYSLHVDLIRRNKIRPMANSMRLWMSKYVCTNIFDFDQLYISEFIFIYSEFEFQIVQNEILNANRLHFRHS